MLINLFGLVVAFAMALLSGVFLIDEYKYDTLHSKRSKIYRLIKENVSINDNKSFLTSETSGMMGPTIAERYPEVQSFLRVLPWFDPTVVEHDEEHVYVERPVYVDSSFFSFFDFKLVQGNPMQALTRPASVVLSESVAHQLFGDINPLDELVMLFDNVPFTVTGVVEDAPEHSHLQFDVLISWTTTVPQVGPFAFDFMNNWLGQTHFTYLLLQPGINIQQLEQKFPEMMQDHFPERADSYLLQLQKFDDIYLGSNEIMTYSDIKMGSKTYVNVFLFASMFILLIAVVNYVNISTAKATKRAAEIGMRKVLGANRKQLVSQFLSESFLLVLLGAATSLLVADLLLPVFNNIVGKSLSPTSLFTLEIVGGLVLLVILVTLLAGIYPAIILSGYQPKEVLIKSGKSKIAGHLPRQVLTTFQFFVALGLIIATIIVFDQTRFLVGQRLGFDKEHVMVVPLENNVEAKQAAFRNDLVQYADIERVAVCQASLGNGTFGTTVIPEGVNEERSVNIFRVDAHFIQTMGIEMRQGHVFRPEISSDSSGLIINQTFVDMMGWDDPLSKTIKFNEGGEPYRIIGVTNDFHFEGLNTSKVRPVVMYLHSQNLRNMTIRLSGRNLNETIQFIENTWKQYESKYPFTYFFADDWFNAKYQKEQQLLATVSTFAIFSIVLACLGLYGLTAFTVEQRIKEIGIRKVLGATVSQLTLMLNRKFVLLVVLAFVVSGPVVYYLMEQWLAGFAYRIDISLIPFGLALLFTLLITLVAVSYQAAKAALTNPVDTLRSE